MAIMTLYYCTELISEPLVAAVPLTVKLGSIETRSRGKRSAALVRKCVFCLMILVTIFLRALYTVHRNSPVRGHPLEGNCKPTSRPTKVALWNATPNGSIFFI